MREAGQPMIKGLGGRSSPKEGIGGAGGSKSGHLGDGLRRQCGQMVVQHRGRGSGAQARMKWVRRRAHRATAAVTFIVAKRSEGEGVSTRWESRGEGSGPTGGCHLASSGRGTAGASGRQ
jgi:hypothetical protein